MEKQTEKKIAKKMKDREKSFRKSDEGITLIALVITVIVLIVLARHFY